MRDKFCTPSQCSDPFLHFLLPQTARGFLLRTLPFLRHCPKSSFEFVLGVIRERSITEGPVDPVQAR